MNLTWPGTATGGIGGFATQQRPVVLLLSEESVPIPRVLVNGTLYLHRAVVRIGASSVPGWGALKTVWLTRPGYHGPLVVRGRELDGSAPVDLGGDPGMKHYVLPSGPDINGGDGYRPGISYVWLKRPGCYGFQMDGITFSHHVVVDVLPKSGA